jgi:hypothetical protein
MHRIIVFTGVLALMLIAGLHRPTAQDYRVGDIVVADPWARAAPLAGRPGAAYMALTNTGTVDDRLIAAGADVAGTVELHSHTMTDGVMRMRRVEGGIPVPAGETVALAPGGLHVMLIDLAQPLAVGDRFPLILTFAESGDVTVDVAVRPIDATGPEPRAEAHHGAGMTMTGQGAAE